MAELTEYELARLERERHAAPECGRDWVKVYCIELDELLSAYRDRQRWAPVVRAAIASVAAGLGWGRKAQDLIDAVGALKPEHRPEPSDV